MARLFKLIKVVLAKLVLLALGSILVLPTVLFACKFAFAEFIAYDSPALDVKGVFMLSGELSNFARKQIIKQLVFALFVAAFAAACLCSVMLAVRGFLNFPKIYFAMLGCGYGALVALIIFYCLAHKTYQNAKNAVFLQKQHQN